MRRLGESPGARRRFPAVLVVLAGAATLSLAHAESRFELDWDAPPECPQGPAVRRKLDVLLGEAASKKRGLRADGRITRVDGNYRLTLTVHDEKGARHRTIDAETCGDLSGAAAVTLGLLLRDNAATERGDNSVDRDAGSAAGTTGQNSSSAVPSAAAPSATATPPSAAATPPGAAAAKSASQSETPATTSLGRRWNVFVHAPALHMDFVRLPKPSVGLGGGVGFRYDEWRFEGSGRIYFDQALWSNLASPDAGADVNRVVVEAWACRAIRSGDLEFAPCLTVGLEHLRAEGAGTDVQPQSAAATSAVFGAAALGQLRLASWVALVATAGLGLETARPRLTVTSLGEVQQLGSVVVSVGIGSEWIF